MSRYRKIAAAAILFCLAVYTLISAVWQRDNGDTFTANMMLAAVIFTVFVIDRLIVSAERMDPYRDAALARRRETVLRRTLKLYAGGLADGGAFAAEVLTKLPKEQTSDTSRTPVQDCRTRDHANDM